MPREIIQGDIEVAQKLLFTHQDPAQITAALVYRGLDEQTATRLVEDLKSGRQVTVQPTEKPNTRRDPVPGQRSSVVSPPSVETTRDMTRRASKRQLPIQSKKKLLAGICVMFVVATALLALPATRDELRWFRVSHDESVADEQAYLDAWPNGRHAGEARARIQRHAWSVAFGLDSIEGFQAYLDAVPEGEHVAEAREKIEALKWEAAVAANGLEHFEGFLRDYPDSQHATRARAQIEALTRIQATAQQFAFKYPVNQSLSYAQGVKLKMNMDIKAGAESIKLKMAFDVRYTVKLTALKEPQDGVTPVRLEPSGVEVDWDITGPAGHIVLNLRGSQMKGTQNGIVIIDTARDIGVAQAQDFKKEIMALYLSGQADLDARGNTKKFRGDPPFVEFWTEAGEGQLGFFGSVFPERPVAVGGSWTENLSLKKIGQVMLEAPGLQGIVTFTRLPDSIVRGKPLATFNISAPFYQKGLKGSLEEGGQRTRLNVSHLGRRANGTFHFDQARGVLVDSKITGDGDGAMRTVVQGQEADMTLDMIMEVRTTLLEEKPAATTR